MSIVAWITLGLIPGILAGVLVAHYRQAVRARASDSKLTSMPRATDN
jgi:hypothetical protein